MTDHTLNRLRAANLFPAASAVDAEALFERIVLAPPDRRLARKPRSYRRPVLVLVAAVLACGLLASGAYAISGWIGHIIDGPTVQAEYTAAQNQLTLPPGYSWPPLNWPPNAVTSRGAGGSYAVNIDQDAWECYWVHAIRSDDVAAQRQAKSALDDLMTNHIVIAPAGAPEDYTPPQSAHTPTAAFADDGGYQLKQRMYVQAAAGKPKLLEQSCRANGPSSNG